MSGIIQKPIYPRLQERFKLQQNGNPFLVLSDVLIPTTDADEIVRTPSQQQTISTNTTRTDTYTVPIGEIWYLKNVSINTDYNRNIYVYKTVSGTNFLVYYNGGSTPAVNLTNQDLKILPGEAITIVMGAASSGAITSCIIYNRELIT